MYEVVARMCSTKKISWKFHKIHREAPVLGCLSNIAKCVQAVRLATLLKRHPHTGVSETAIFRSSAK